MPGCSLQRELIGSTAWFHIAGKFDGACAWELAGRIQSEPLGDVTLDFSQRREFADYCIAVLANLLLSVPHKRVQLASLRQHQAQLFKDFGVDVGEPLHEPPDSTPSVEGPTVA